MSEVQQETGDFKKPAQPPMSVEKQQEAMLMSKYQNLPPKGGAFLQKRLAKSNKKFFDSGDYNMAKAKMSGKKIQAQVQPNEVTGDHMPTPDELPQVKKTSSKLVTH